MKAFNVWMLCLALAACSREGQKYPLISEASAAMVDSISHSQNIELDLSIARVNEMHRVAGRQIYYDLGTEPSKAGSLSVRLNSTQSGPITLAPGGTINFSNVTSLFVSNDAQPGKSAALLVNENASVSNNPTSPLSSGVYNTFDPARSYSHKVFTYNLGLPAPIVYETLIAAQPENLIVHQVSGAVTISDYDVKMAFIVSDGVTSYYVDDVGNGNFNLKPFILPAGYSFYVGFGRFLLGNNLGQSNVSMVIVVG